MHPSRLLDGRLKLRHLVLVDALVSRGSVVAAAAALQISQPVVTRALHELEDVLGVPLFDRHPRGVTPTIFGTAFTEHARAVLAQLAAASRHVSELADAERGTVTVGTHLAGSNLLLPRAIAALKRRHPQLTVVVHEATPEALAADLGGGHLDLVVGRLSATGARPGTQQRTLYDEPIVLAVRQEHPALRLRSPTLVDLIDLPWILPGTGTALRGELEQMLAAAGLGLPGDRIECTSILTVRTLLTETDVVAALPMLIAQDDPRVTTLGVSLAPISHTVGVTVSSGRPPSPSTTALLGTLSDEAAAMRALHRPGP